MARITLRQLLEGELLRIFEQFEFWKLEVHEDRFFLVRIELVVDRSS